jgi:hypothetical protein
MRRQKPITATTIITTTTTTTIKGEFSDSADGGVFVRRRFLACINQEFRRLKAPAI